VAISVQFGPGAAYKNKEEFEADFEKHQVASDDENFGWKVRNCSG
jgi:hypothetical protein